MNSRLPDVHRRAKRARMKQRGMDTPARTATQKNVQQLLRERATHLSAIELEMLDLAGLPGSKRAINRRADREGWSFVERGGYGGGRRYAVVDLPQIARDDLRGRRIEQIGAAARPAGRPTGSDFFSRNPDIAAAVEIIVAERGLAAPRILELLAGEYAGLPNVRTLQRFMARLEKEKPALIAARRDPDRYKGAFRVSLGRADASVSYAHELWELDTTPADVLTRGGRRMILGAIDRWSRRARLMVVPSESGQSVRRLLIDTIRRWGVMPAAVMTDNGAGFINASIRSVIVPRQIIWAAGCFTLVRVWLHLFDIMQLVFDEAIGAF